MRMNNIHGRSIVTTVILLSFFFMFISVVAAAPAEKMSVQGRLTNTTDGSSLTGTYSINFSLWDNPSAGTMQYNETLSVTTDTNGLYSVVLTPTDEAIFTDSLWMALKIDSDDEMSPRMNLTTSPYAYQALDLQCTNCIGGTEIDESSLDDVEVGTVTNTYGCYGIASNVVECNDAGFTYASGSDALTITGSINVGSSGLFANSTHVGIGTANPTQALTVNGNISFEADSVNPRMIIVEAGGSENFNLYVQAADGVGTSGTLGGNLYLDGGVGVGSGEAGDVILQTTAGGIEGFVGIGTASPSALLHIIDTTEQMRIGYDTSNYMSVTAGNKGNTLFDLYGTGPQVSFRSNTDAIGFFQIEDNDGGTAVFSVDTITERVGIGTSSPNSTLQVAGNITPTANNTYSLGNSTLVWKDVYVGSSSLHIGGVSLSSVNNKLEWGGSINFDSSTATINTTSGKNLTVTSGVGNVIIRLG